MHNTVIRGDFSNITISRYCFIDEGTTISPSHMPLPTPSVVTTGQEDSNPDVTYVPMHIGKYTHIGRDCTIQAASIGLGCHIENNCIVSNRAILKDHVLVLEGSVVASDFVAPPFAILAGILSIGHVCHSLLRLMLNMLVLLMLGSNVQAVQPGSWERYPKVLLPQLSLTPRIGLKSSSLRSNRQQTKRLWLQVREFMHKTTALSRILLLYVL